MNARRVLSLVLSLTLGLVLVAVLLILVDASARAQASTHYVAPDGDCGEASPCYATVQAAVDAAATGDVIKVAAGTYTPVGVRPRDGVATTPLGVQMVYLNKSVLIQGGNDRDFSGPPDPDANPTTLHAAGQGRVVHIAEDIKPVLENLQLVGGYTGGGGGGVYLSYTTAKIINCRILDNRARGYGGGLYADHSTVRLIDSLVQGNVSGSGGGGLFLGDSTATLTGNIVQSNRSSNWDFASYSGEGGGLYVSHSTVTLAGNIVQGNEGGGSRWGSGGGLFLAYSTATLTNNIIQYNHAPGMLVCSEGGGLYAYQSELVLSGNIVRGNETDSGLGDGRGGGLYLAESTATLDQNMVVGNIAIEGGGLCLSGSDVTLVNTVIADNQGNGEGSGLHIEGCAPRLLHTTIARNTGATGISVTDGGAPTLINTLLVSHSMGINVAAGSMATLEATLWGQGAWANQVDWGGAGTVVIGTNNTWGAPAFVNPGAGDYHLGRCSAAVDRAVNAGVTVDMDGELRPGGAGYDIGADEYWGEGCNRLYVPLVLRKRP